MCGGSLDGYFTMAHECMELEFSSEPLPENSLRRSNSLPMINNACDSVQAPVSGYPRPRRNSVSLSGGLSLEEGMDVMNRDPTQDRDVHAAMQIGQSWEDFSLQLVVPPLQQAVGGGAAAGGAAAAAAGAAAEAVGGGAFFQRRPQPARRSNSPSGCVRPGTFGCLKRKVDPSNEMPSKRMFPGPATATTATLLSTSREFPIIPHPLTHSLSWSSLESGESCSPPQKVPPSGPQPEPPKVDTFLPPFTPASRPSAM